MIFAGLQQYFKDRFLAEVLAKVEEEFQKVEEEFGKVVQLLVLEIVSFFSGCFCLLCVYSSCGSTSPASPPSFRALKLPSLSTERHLVFPL